MTTQEKKRLYQKAYRQRHPERVKASKDKWRKNNPERHAKHSKDWRLRNPEKAKQVLAQYAKSNPEYIALKRRKRRALLSNAVHERYTVREVYLRDNGLCSLCESFIDLEYPARHPLSVSIDHIVPLSKGGHDTLDNVSVAHYGCNSRKGNR